MILKMVDFMSTILLLYAYIKSIRIYFNEK
ncbi:hypothetical protein ACQ27_gp341 [Klebsiella phage K64-1]|nr:hypothetical protein ACQ27_gp341 [Klebsiella phage K64-1]